METERVKRVLNMAADLIDKGFTKEEAARDKKGNGTSPFDPKASCFCAIGAIQLATYLSAGNKAEAGDQNTVYYSAIKAVKDRAEETGAIPSPFFTAYHLSSSLLYNWSDSPNVTGADVSALFRDTAAHVGKKVHLMAGTATLAPSDTTEAGKT